MSQDYPKIAQIVAISNNRCIGKNNALPWHIPADLQHFKQLTTQARSDTTEVQGIIIMGRKTFESMGSRPLPKRINIIITTQQDYASTQGLKDKPHLYVVHQLNDALVQAGTLAKEFELDTIWVIGGERVFTEAMPVTDRIELTVVDTEIKGGDAFYPTIPSHFHKTDTSPTYVDENSGLSYRFERYEVAE